MFFSIVLRHVVYLIVSCCIRAYLVAMIELIHHALIRVIDIRLVPLDVIVRIE